MNRFGCAFTTIVMLSLVGPAVGDTFVVNDTTDAVDNNPGDGVCATANGTCTLRAAIQDANAHAGTDVIELPAGNFLLTLVGAAEVMAAIGDQRRRASADHYRWSRGCPCAARAVGRSGDTQESDDPQRQFWT